MISEDFRFEGFDASDFLNLLALFRPARAAQPRSEDADQASDPGAPLPRGTLVLVVDAAGVPCAALVPGRGPVLVPEDYDEREIAALCRRHSVERAVLVDEGAIEELTERAAQRLPLSGDYATQWLTLLTAARELEDEGKLRYHPPRTHLPLPTPAMLRRVLELVLPEDHVVLVAMWDGSELWTACALHRRGNEIDRFVGPKLLLDWAGPLSGDYRRDQRALRRAVEHALGPVHIGLFAQREAVEALLREPQPGSWARAVALREVIIHPAPRYVHLALAADAARAAGSRARDLLGGFDFAGYVAPAAQFARMHVARIGSVTQILGFNPLQALAARLRRQPPEE